MHGSPVHRTRVKICGITRPEDGVRAAEAGADAIGLVFYARSPRAVDAARAREILAALPPFVTTVGLFVDADPSEVEGILKRVPLGLLQFHGKEPAQDCEGYGLPWMKAVQVRPGVDLRSRAEEYAGAQALLLDAWHPEVPGGTGNRFDWSLIPAQLDKPIVLAGGLDGSNVESAIQAVRPYGVDVSSGVEAGKGIKDPIKIAAFMRGVERADAR